MEKLLTRLPETFMHFHPYYRELIQRLGTKIDSKDSEDDIRHDTSYRGQNIYLDSGRLTEQAIQNANKKSSNMEQAELSDEQLMICSATVRGFSLARNKWSESSLHALSTIV
jgi:hypothetical protein